jgi:putative transposase
MLREADSGKRIVELCREKNISDMTFHRWKREFGLMEVNKARRLKKPEKEKTGLKKRRADARLANRVLRFVNGKNCEPRAQKRDDPGRALRRSVLWASRLPDSAPAPLRCPRKGRFRGLDPVRRIQAGVGALGEAPVNWPGGGSAGAAPRPGP